MNGVGARDWTDGPARWGAAVVLGVASIAGMVWSIFWRQPAPVIVVAPETGPIARQETKAPEPSKAPVAQARPDATPRPAKININTATAAELELLPGIGPAIAARIVEHRAKNGPFKSVTALDDVKGIGPKTVEALRTQVTVE